MWVIVCVHARRIAVRALQKVATETADWLNVFFKKSWAVFNEGLSQYVADTIQPSLDWAKPDSVVCPRRRWGGPCVDTRVCVVHVSSARHYGHRVPVRHAYATP